MDSFLFRNKIWLLFFAFFVFWYFVLYGFDWSSFPGFKSNLRLENPIQSIDKKDELALIHPEESLISTFSTDNSGNVVETLQSQDAPPTKDFEDLEKELERILAKDESRFRDKLCKGRYIYLHDLPSRFNEDLIKQCKTLNPWIPMCQYLVNGGFGPLIRNNSWYNTNQFALELIFHNRMKEYECLTNDSSKAEAIFVPFYAGLDISRYLWGGYNVSRRDADSLDLINWLKKQPEWRKMYGRDHFMIAGRITWDFRRDSDEDDSWGNKLMVLPESKNMTILTIESSPWNRNDMAIPYPTYFHPMTAKEVMGWQNKTRKMRRRNLFCFAGGARGPDMPAGSIREHIMEQCRSARKCAMIECNNDDHDNKHNCHKPENLMRLFQSSIFCLQPPGDSLTRRSTFDAISAGCIPVFFHPGSAYVQYHWHLPMDYTKYSVLIPENGVKSGRVSIESVLSRIPRVRVNAMMEEVIKLIPNVVYANPRSKDSRFEDAFDLTMKGIVKRVNTLRKEISEESNQTYDFDEFLSWKFFTFGTLEKHEWDHFFIDYNNNVSSNQAS